MTKAVNIVSFNIPYPPNYGGVIDVFFKIKALNEAGFEIYLHTFIYDRTPSEELKRFCKKIYYYKRNTGIIYNFSLLPYIVYSRKNKELLYNLNLNEHPIIFEGLHTCYYLGDKSLKDRMCIYRESNIEHEYYYHLANAETSFWKSSFYRIEALKLKYFENKINNAELILAVSKDDSKYLQNKYPSKKVHFLPSFKGVGSVLTQKGKGQYILYHANLRVAENKKAGLYLINNVFSKIEYTCVVAGLGPDQDLFSAADKYSNVSIKADLSNEEMDQLISNAHIHVMFTFQPTGLKLKLMNALFKGRFCIVNEEMLAGTGLETLCEVVNEPGDFVDAINRTMLKKFTQDIIDRRNKVLSSFTDAYLAEALIKELTC